MGSERSIVSAIRVALGERGWLVIKMHGGLYGQAGIPDLLCVNDGRYVWLEVKQPGGKVTPIQFAQQDRLRDHGAEVYIVYSREDALYRCETQSHDAP